MGVEDLMGMVIEFDDVGCFVVWMVGNCVVLVVVGDVIYVW